MYLKGTLDFCFNSTDCCNIIFVTNDIHLMSRVVRKPTFCICENKDADQLRGYREADQCFVFDTKIVQPLYFLNTKFQTSRHLLWLYSLVCIGPGRKLRSPVFSQRDSNNLFLDKTGVNQTPKCAELICLVM